MTPDAFIANMPTLAQASPRGLANSRNTPFCPSPSPHLVSPSSRDRRFELSNACAASTTLTSPAPMDVLIRREHENTYLMAQLTVDIGGKPGVNCRGYCEYCYFKHVKETQPFGCRHCPPYKVGCDYCSRSVREYYQGWKSLRQVGDETLATLQMMTGDLDRVTISGGGDPSCYPEFTDLIEPPRRDGGPAPYRVHQRERI